MKRRSWIWLVAASLATVACNAILGIGGDVTDPRALTDDATAADGGELDGSADAPGGSTTVVLGATSLAIVQTGRATLDVSITSARATGLTSVTLEGLPRGVTVTPPVLSITGTGTDKLVLHATAFAARGLASASVVVHPSDEPARSIPVTIDVGGPMDRSFGDNGVVTLGANVIVGTGNTLRDTVGLAVQSDDGFLVAFSRVPDPTKVRGGITRFLKGGVVDTTFANAGTLLMVEGSRAYDVALLADGTPAVVGSVYDAGNPEMFVGALDGGAFADTDHLNDAAFIDEALWAIVPLGDAGAMTVGLAPAGIPGPTSYLMRMDSRPLTLPDAGQFAPRNAAVPATRAYALLKLSESAVLLAGESTGAPLRGSISKRMTSNGNADATFGVAAGTLVTPLNGLPNDFRGAALGDGGAIVLAGGATSVATAPVFDTWRVTRVVQPAGSLDTTFGDGGTALLQPSQATAARADAVIVEADGSVIIGGYADLGGRRNAAFAKFDAAGALDPTFGNEGVVFIDLGTPAEVKRMVRHGNGILAAIITSSTSASRDVTLVRLSPKP